MDLGLKIKGKDLVGCLEILGFFGSMCIYCVKLSEVGEVDGELLVWLKEVYEMVG